MVPAASKSAGKQKQSPLVVKNLSFCKLLAVMASCEVKPDYKMNWFDLKVICYTVNDFDIVREHLKKTESAILDAREEKGASTPRRTTTMTQEGLSTGRFGRVRH